MKLLGLIFIYADVLGLLLIILAQIIAEEKSSPFFPTVWWSHLYLNYEMLSVELHHSYNFCCIAIKDIKVYRNAEKQDLQVILQLSLSENSVGALDTGWIKDKMMAWRLLFSGQP